MSRTTSPLSLFLYPSCVSPQVPQLAAIREACDAPLDIYVEAPDNFGGFVRHYEVRPVAGGAR